MKTAVNERLARRRPLLNLLVHYTLMDHTLVDYTANTTATASVLCTGQQGVSRLSPAPGPAALAQAKNQTSIMRLSR